MPEHDDQTEIQTEIGRVDEVAWPLLSELDLAICVGAADTIRPTRLAATPPGQPPATAVSRPTASRESTTTVPKR
jgi:hypothetical protein